jgi:hypothetical protein
MLINNNKNTVLIIKINNINCQFLIPFFEIQLLLTNKPIDL